MRDEGRGLLRGDRSRRRLKSGESRGFEGVISWDFMGFRGFCRMFFFLYELNDDLV